MLSGLFKRKDKKGKGVGMDSMDSDAEPSTKQSEEFGRESPQSKPSDELSLERTSSDHSGPPSRQSSRGKLQKPQRGREESPSKVKGILKTEEPLAVQEVTTQEPVADKPVTQTTSTMRMVPSEEDGESTERSIEERALSPEKPSSLNAAASKLNPLNITKPAQNGEAKPEKVKTAKQRVQLDDFDSDEEEKDPFADPDMQTQSARSNEPDPTGRLSESPVHVSAADAQPPAKPHASEKDAESDSQQPPGLTGDTSSQETSSPISTPTPDDGPATTQPSKPSKPTISTSRAAREPDPTEPTSASSLPPPSRPAPVPETAMDDAPPNSSESTMLPAWSDHSLRMYLDDGSDIRDMLLVINDTTGVVPVGPEHPIMAQLFVEETKTVSGLSSQLDSLLNGLLEKRLKRSASASSKATSPVGGR
ncbi:hypothetical protein BU23DRAFT_488909 [Bimuria novae-zelandiae CBS 107.79]|uniref:Uncharacterized protein n=1 Tax=Bimuria novae-zelandiae CBS 107.79 TaxID=1447943 RepID=A0A6A5ULR5_9PLEO|nr:hypothetical protein BU23DRAFT_488909 [Bimuria novae-zelandiae CBS 107.79]